MPTIVPLPSTDNGNQAIGAIGITGNTIDVTGSETEIQTDEYGSTGENNGSTGENNGSTGENDGSEAGSSNVTVKPVIELEDNTVITGETLTNMGISGEVELKLDNGVTWDIDLTGADMAALSIDLQVDIGSAEIPDEVIGKLNCDEYMLMSLSHDGEFA